MKKAKEESGFEERFFQTLQTYLEQENEPLAGTLLKIIRNGHCVLEPYDIGFEIGSDDCIYPTHAFFYVPIENYAKYDAKAFDDFLLKTCQIIMDPHEKYLITDVQVVIQYGGEDNCEDRDENYKPNFHPYIQANCLRYFDSENYLQAVLEASKYYVKKVQLLSCSSQDGSSLMLDVFKPAHPKIKVTSCQSTSEKSYQDGFRYLSAGLVAAFRNPAAHEPEDMWKFSRDDCLDILYFISFMLRKLDVAEINPD